MAPCVLARLQRCSTRLVCVSESIRWSSAVPARVGVCSAGRRGLNRRRACRRAENPDSYWEFKSSLSLPLLPVPLSPSLSLSFSLSPCLFLSLCCKFLLFPSLFTSLPVCVFMPSLGFYYAHRIDLLPAGVQTRATKCLHT